MKKSNLVIVYHRQPYEEVVEDGKTVYRENSSPNGIVPTLKSFFGEVEQAAWVAWKQVDPKDKKTFERVVRMKDSYGEYNVSRLPLTAHQVRSFYHVTSKEALWPILHSFPEKYNYDPVDWETFREVNWLFAEAAVQEAAEGAVIWVHDYNLWLVPLYVKQFRPDVKVAFFHHTPFPEPSMFNILPWRAEIIESLLHCDLVGFHIPRYAMNFVSTARSLKKVEILEEIDVEDGLSPHGMALSVPKVATRIGYEGREIAVDAFPVGTNVGFIDELCASEKTHEREKAIKETLNDRKFIISVGRSDYTKGTRDMLLAFERLLGRRPELMEKVQLLVTSVAANSGMTVYRNVQREIEQIAGRINGKYSTLAWQPLVLFTQAIPFDELVAYYRCADICWITPLRDGLNLVAKEYIAARGDLKSGALVLSEFTGAAIELPTAIMANPYSNRNMDAAIDQAIDMPAEEQTDRLAAMLEKVRLYDSVHWAQHTVERFRGIPADPRYGMKGVAA
ncbi:glucosylglycerol-phosphate synthase [Ancylobacter sp. MQZ15Z-1]|uniref:Glucosylglycerol-phosphate synthase n=1 Tax=Ancylobacter mangrovi TaxID=2972472 RepID=A0A9X2PEY3_9HYPH|nr:glucosylglycerol-phosphate synthase [Ancylobacter mangrovi]MCS0497456.1 glucosylglycerol-phosphate synthase [Ancylobacter mangrovi]